MYTNKVFLGTSIFAGLLLLTACGGGGSGGGGSNSGFVEPDISHTPIQINASNETELTQAGIDATNGSADLGSQVPLALVFSGGGDMASSGNQASNPVSPNAIQFVKRALTEKIGSDSGLNRNVSGVEIEFSDQCDISGTESTVGDVADPISNSFSSGDYVTTTYNNCDDGNGEVLNGSIAITFNSDFSIPASFDPINLDITVRFDNFRSTQTGYGTVTLDGEADFTMGLSGGMITFSMSGESIYIVEPDSSSHLTNFDINYSDDDANSESILDANFTIANTMLDGQITVDAYLVTPWDTQFPPSGTLTLIGDNSQLDVDVVGDGTVNVTLIINDVVQAGYPKSVTLEELDVEINGFVF